MSYSSNVYPPNKGQMDSLLTKMDGLIAAINKQTEFHTWEQIQANVQAGVGTTLYPVGHQFIINHSVYGSHKWDVVAHDNNPSATGKPHTMTLLMHDCLADIQFDAPEAMYYCASALPAGTYNFTISSTWVQAVAGTYQFTLTAPVPQGGQIVGPIYIADTAPSNWRLSTYASPSSTTPIESDIVVSSGSGGTSLGNITSPNNDNINHIHRIGYGSNNYKESAMRQFLNSDSPAGFWTPKTKFDRPPGWNASLEGFLKGLPSEFLNVLDTATVKCSSNNNYESPDSSTPKNTAYTVSDKIFLASCAEVGFGQTDVADGSTVWGYYNGATNPDRIKLLGNSARYWWLRTPRSGYAGGVRGVGLDGSLDGSGAYGGLGVVPACIIA